MRSCRESGQGSSEGSTDWRVSRRNACTDGRGGAGRDLESGLEGGVGEGEVCGEQVDGGGGGGNGVGGGAEAGQVVAGGAEPGAEEIAAERVYDGEG